MPTKIGPYQLIAKIGEGGMGTVWLTKLEGRLAGFNKLAVVKELREDLAGSAEFVDMFLNEARLAARLTHPNVVHTYGANEDEGRLYIAMEYLDGQPWSHVRHVLWSNRSLPLAMHLKVLAETLSGLHYAHELRDYDGKALQVVHRDMSPQNTFVTYDGQVKVVDFGVARAVTSTQRKDANLFVGKLAYSAPEQVRGEALDRRADIFAVGVMLWEALAGRRLMVAENRADAVRQRVAQHAPRIREVVPSVPRVLADICDRALALDPADRYSTSAEFRDALLGYLDDTSQDVDASQLGQLIGNAFGEERRKISSLIERNLMHPSPVPAPVADLIDTLRPIPADHTLRADLSELASVSRLRDDRAVAEASSSVAVRVVKPQRPWQLAAIAVATTLATAVWLLSTSDHDSVKSTPLPVTPVTQSPVPQQQQPQPQQVAPAVPALPPAVQPAPQPAGATIELSINATPADATIYLDGVPLPSNPYKGKVKTDGELHLIRVSAPSAQTVERVVSLDRDKTLDIELPPKVAERSSWRPRRSSGSGKPASRSEPTQVEEKRPSARADEPDFDTRIKTDSRSKEIYEEDPYK